MRIFNAPHFLRHISMPTLREFTDGHDFGPSLVIDWTGPEDHLPATVNAAVAAIEATLTDPELDPDKRKDIEKKLQLWTDDLRRAHVMSNELSIKYFQMACATDGEALAAFAIRDPREQSLWMLTFRNRVFRDAEMQVAFQANSNGKYWKKHRIQPGLDPTTDQDKLKAFGREVAKLYKRVGGGDGTHIEVSKHPSGDSVQLSIYFEGPITALAHFRSSRTTPTPHAASTWH